MRAGGDRTLAIDPTSQGFCFVVLQGAEMLLDWECAEVPRRERAKRRARIEKIMHRYGVRLVVLEDMALSRKGAWARECADDIEAIAREEGVDVVRVSRREVQNEFRASGTDKQQIAEAIARFFPELAPRLPRPRTRPYLSEDERMNIFDAVSFALTAVRARRRGE